MAVKLLYHNPSRAENTKERTAKLQASDMDHDGIGDSYKLRPGVVRISLGVSESIMRYNSNHNTYSYSTYTSTRNMSGSLLFIAATLTRVHK